MAIETLKQQSQGGMMEKLMKRKGISGEIFKENEGEFVGLRNNLQMVLALKKFGESQDNSAAHIWFEKYSKKFSEVFDQIIDDDHLFFDGYANIGDIPEEKWQRLENELYKEE